MSTATTPRPAPTPAPDPSTFVRVRTTLPRRPLPPNAARHPVLTPRLALRPLTLDDLPALHELRTQPEVMRWTALQRPDRDLDETRAKIENFVGPTDTNGSFNCAICDRETGKMIGIGGCHAVRSKFGWPEVGYMLRKECWGKGLATEFLKGWVGAWEGLEREEVELEVDARTAGEEVTGADGRVREQAIAVTAPDNDRSQGVLVKAGFEWFTTWVDEDLTPGVEPGTMIELPTYRLLTGGKKGE